MKQTWTRRGRTLAVVALGVLNGLAIMPSTPAGAAAAVAEEAGAGGVQPCSLRPARTKPASEFASCVTVGATLNRAPALGETAILTVDVEAQYDRPGATVEVDIPDTLEVVDELGGWQRSEANAPFGAGRLARVTTNVDLAKALRRDYRLRVRAVKAGPGQIVARATAPGAAGEDGGADTADVTVGAPGESSTLSLPHDPSGEAVPPPPGTPPATTDPSSPEPAVDRFGRVVQPAVGDGTQPAAAPGGACVTGVWQYVSSSGASRPSRNFRVEVWDDDSGPDDLMYTGLTSATDGSYTFCVESSDFDEGGNVDLFVNFSAENNLWKVTDYANVRYNWSTGTASNVSGTHSFGTLQPGSSLGMTAVQQFDNAHDAWSWTPRSAQGCWDKLDSTCRQLVIRWDTTGSAHCCEMHPDTNEVHMGGTQANERSVVVHEIGHWVMDEVYDDYYPPSNCPSHDIPTTSNTVCAWTEGFAEWYPAMVFGDPTYHYGNGTGLTRDLEGNTWSTSGWNLGDAVEGRVAAALIDLSDYTNESPWDRFGEGAPGNVWETFVNNRTDTFAQFWQQRANAGYNTADTGGNGGVYQSTIDYSFRDPLTPYAELSRPQPQGSTNRHAYSYPAPSNYWSAVATRPTAPSDTNLYLFSDLALTTQLKSSIRSGSVVDFVAVDSNVRSLQTYYPQVRDAAGNDGYGIELAAASQQLPAGRTDLYMGGGDIVHVRDVSLPAGVPVTIRLAPANTIDADIYLMESNASTNVVSLVEAVASSANDGAGAVEQISYTPPAGANTWHGLVVVNKGGAGWTTIDHHNWTLTSQSTGTGTGYVSSTPTGINSCSGTCSAGFGHNHVVTLSASAAGGSAFAGWGGACAAAGTNSQCNVTMDASKSVTATFNGLQRSLTVNKTGNGAASGLVTSDPSGISCGNVCTATYTNGVAVTLFAQSQPGVTFRGWGVSDCPGTGTCNLSMNANKTVNPEFTINTYTLSVNKQGSGPGGGTVTSDPAGISCGATCSAVYNTGTNVTLYASTATGYTFTGWGVSDCPGTGPCTLTMSGNKTVSPTFNIRTYVLTVTKQGNGSGTVTSSPGGISCGATCSATYNHGTNVTLTATAAAGSTFTGWGVSDCPGTGTCTLPMTATKGVQPTFTLGAQTLSVAKTGPGTGTVSSNPAGISCGATCSAGFPAGTQVTLTAAPSANSIFTGWSGDCSGTSPCVVTMSAARNVVADFAIRVHVLSVAKSGAGTGTVTSSPAGISCGASCSAAYNDGTNVVLTAAPAQGSTFSGWSGACTGTGTCTVSMTAARSVTATFGLGPQTLTVNKQGAGAGTVTSNPAGISCGATCSASFPGGSSVTLTASPSAGSVFTGWGSGLCAGTGPCTISMTAARSVNPTFDPPGPSTVAISNAWLTEPPSVNANMTYTVTRGGDLSAAASVGVSALTTGSATAGGDFVGFNATTVSFAAGESAKTVTVGVKPDAAHEFPETVLLKLSGPVGVSIVDDLGEGTIFDGDNGVASSLSVRDVTVSEGAGNAVVTIVRTGDTTEVAALYASTATGSNAGFARAGAGSDYTALTSTFVRFLAGETTKTVTVPIAADSSDEANEQLVVNLRLPSRTWLADTRAVVTIIDDDGAANTSTPLTFVSISDARVLEGDSGTQVVPLTLTRSGATTGVSSVSVATSTATSATPNDFDALGPTTVSFAVGETTKTVNITVRGDTLPEAMEIVPVTLTSPSNTALADNLGQVVIADQDAGSAAAISIGDAAVIEGDSGTTLMRFTVTRTGATTENVQVYAATAKVGGAGFTPATGGTDYVDVATTKITFLAGETTKTFVVTVNGDTTDTADEQFVVALSSPLRAAIADNVGLGVIVNDD